MEYFHCIINIIALILIREVISQRVNSKLLELNTVLINQVVVNMLSILLSETIIIPCIRSRRKDLTPIQEYNRSKIYTYGY